MPFTLVAFHAHPDDEALLTAGTLALAAAAGHRVVVVTATDGRAGLAGAAFGVGADLAERRMGELDASARLLGAARTRWLGYADSGLDGAAPDPDGTCTFVRAGLEDAAERLARILDEEDADVVTGYDACGGYGHPDHVRVHHVARRARELAGTPLLLEATVDRDRLARALRWGTRLRVVPPEATASGLPDGYTPRCDLTHEIDVRSVAAVKRDAVRAHASQATGADTRTLAALGGLPLPLFRLVMGREWFVEAGRTPGRALSGDVFEALG